MLAASWDLPTGLEELYMENSSHPALILIEGLPGSGKSTLAHFLTRCFARQGIASRWWYEEESGHPLYLFHDQASLQQVFDELAAGNYRQVVDAVLEKWRALSRTIQTSRTVVIFDSCLFGYLTWTLFPYDVPIAAISAYLMQVEQIIRANNPRLIYLYQDDVAAAFRKVCARRGGDTEQRFVRNATESAYGKRHGLRGFDDMVSFWRSYRAITDDAFSRIRFPKLAIENAAGDWFAYERAAVRFLGLSITQATEPTVQQPERFVGAYYLRCDAAEVVCRVRWENNDLLVDGLPLVWPENRLVPIAENRFAVESFPFTVEFEEDGLGGIATMIVTGAALLSGTIDTIFVRKRDKTECDRRPSMPTLPK